ncbi:hypothetical protein Glove_271g98 [Diversispora epigaea]|uniref:Uncharacterized protein n=1 Tax=Diversispora epigaea TaxID=1348612 RepID=A0A397I434_9GLOM|nr:hypothetical protein Glove_271g98 [Diversispora epigaea]
MTTKNISFIPFHLEVSIAGKKSSCLNSRPGRQGESRKDYHESYLRITEAICFDFNLEHQQSEYKGLYLLRGKRQKDRWIYVSPENKKMIKNPDLSFPEKETENELRSKSEVIFYLFLSYIKEEIFQNNQDELSIVKSATISLKGRGLKQRLVEITEHIPRINKFILIKEENLIPKQDN